MNPDWFAGRLRELRVAKGLSREQLAKAAGMTVGGIRDLEQGRRQPALASLIAICEALGEPCESLLSQPEKVPAPASGRPRKPSVPAEVPAAPAKKAPRKKGKGK